MGAVIKTALSPLAMLLKPKIPKPEPTPTINRDPAALRAQVSNELARRRGYAANVLTGPSGAEPSSNGGKVLLGQ